MWTTPPQTSTGVNVVGAVTKAGGSDHTHKTRHWKSMDYSDLSSRCLHSYSLCLSLTRIDPYGTKAERTSKALKADENQRSSSETAVNTSSKAYPCTNPHCCRVFLCEKNLRKHLRSNDCQSGIQRFRKSTTHMPTDRVTKKTDFIKRRVADSLSKIAIPCRGGTASTDGTNYDGKVSDHITD